MTREIIVITASGSGHLFPCLQLSSLLSLHGFEPTLLHPSGVSIPSHFLHNPLLRFTPISPDLPLPLPPRPLCAIVDFQMAWTKPALFTLRIPVVSLFTFGACAASVELAAWKARVLDLDLSPGESHALPGLPPEVSLSYSDLRRRPTRGPVLGKPPPWASAVEGSVGLMFNTCRDLERTFLEYMCEEMGLPVWAVGPLLPDPPNSGEVEEELVQWLASKPRGSLLYVSFGSVVGPSAEDCAELARALEGSDVPFLWADPLGIGPRIEVGERGRVIRGWAPQRLILCHPATGGFLTHCGWNSTVEAIGSGVPIMGWPLRGDQFLNAKLAVGVLRVGVMGPAGDQAARKEDLVAGIERLMGDQELKRRAMEVKALFQGVFPNSSQAAMLDFKHFMETSQAA